MKTDGLLARKGLSLLIRVFLLTVVVSPIVNGYVLSVMWRWFVQKLFPTVPVLSVPLAIGLILIVELLRTTNIDFGLEEDNPDAAEQELKKLPNRKIKNVLWHGLQSIIFSALAILVLGWIVKHFL